jgi:NAD(P)-dependent dehydrogenase (short-subunit alcohol dehydrogenase family)
MPKDHFQLTDKIAVVTGASRGIGEAIAKILAEYGAHVVVTSRKVESCQAVVEAISRAGGSAEAFPCHVGEMADISKLFAYLREKHGKLDILVNNAAANPYFGHILDTDLAAFQKTVDVNIRGYFFMSVEGGKLMKETGGGSIINTASVNGLQPGPMQGIYSISKAAVISMTKAFAKECGPLGIRCNALLPGITKTKFAGALFANQDIYDEAMKRTALGRHAEPEEMATTVLYLASSASSYTTGECIVVDGGVTL